MIAVDDLHVSLGDAPVLDGVDLTVDRGEFVGLVGPNGAGKTTLLKAINGSLQPAAGTVTLDGTSIADLTTREISRRVATVHQDTGVRFAFDVETIVAMGRTPYRSRLGGDPEGKEHVERALERTGVADLRDRRISEVSGGERQRVFIARALAQDAPALLLDEPTASLDVNHAAETLALVRRLVDDGKAALAAIHDLEAAARYCDRIVLLHDGTIVASGPPADVLTEANLEAAFDVASVVTTDPVTGAPSVTALPAIRNGGQRVHVVGGGSVTARLLGDLWARGHDVTVGPLTPGDAATSVARSLDVDVTTAPSFTPIDEETRSEIRRTIDAADVTVLVDPAITPDTPLLDLADHAGSLVLVEERPLARRNHAGRDGERAYERLRRRAAVVTPDGVTDLLEEGVPDPPVVSNSG